MVSKVLQVAEKVEMLLEAEEAEEAAEAHMAVQGEGVVLLSVEMVAQVEEKMGSDLVEQVVMLEPD